MAKNAFQEAQDLFARVYRSNIAPAGQRAKAFVSDTSRKLMDDEGYYQRGQFKPSQLPVLKPLTKNVADPYVQNRIIKPAKQVVSSFKQVVAPNQTIKQRGISAGTGVLNTLTTGFALHPATAGTSFLYSGAQGAYGGLQALRQGKNPRQIAENARQTFTGQKYVGLGDALTNNTKYASVLNTGDLVLGMMGKGLDDRFVRGASKALLGRRPAFHPEDAQFLDDALSAIKNKKISIEGKQQAIKIVDDLAERYLSRADIDKTGGKTSKLIKLLQKQSKAVSTYGQEGVVLGIAGNNATQRTQDSTQSYLKDLQTAQKKAKAGADPSIIDRIKTKVAEAKAGLVDQQSAIEDVLSTAEKKGKFKALPQYDIRVNGIDRVLRSKTLGAQFAKDNGMADVIQEAPDLNALNQYLIAKQARDVSDKGIRTGRDLKKDQQLIQDLAEEYEPFAQRVNEYSRKLLQYSVDSGLVSKELAQELTQKYPHYVPLQRVFNELEEKSFRGGSKAIASLGSQSVVQKLKGSEREIINPIESLLTKTQDAFSQGERNKTASMLAKYKDLPGFEGLIKEAPNGGAHTFSYLENGVKKTFETTPEIEAAAKNLNQEQMGLLMRVLNVPTRTLQLGATGLNLPFVITNMLKDELTGFINSNNAAKTSILNPFNFVRSLLSAVKHDDLYDEVVRRAGMGTSFDISRSAPELSVERIRAGRSVGSKIAYTVTHPGELLQAVEDIVGRGEELGRIKNYRGTKEALMKAGRTKEAAEILAAQAARENTANFARKGTWGRTLNYIIPFFNAGIQGSRQLVRSFQNNPVGTSAKVTTALFMPVAAATTWNLSDPQRKQVYDDISTFEKENNILIIPPNPTKDDKGRWNVIKIPIPPGLSNLSALVRRPLEQANGLDPVKFREIASNLVAASTSMDISSPTKLASSTFPQALKLVAEPAFNKNFYSGRDIVPQYMKDKPASEQVFADTSGTARIIGGAINTSPLKVENVIRTGFGGLGSQLQNASDTALNKAGIIPDEQVAGEGAIANIQRRFSKSFGGEIQRRDESKVTQYNAAKKKAIQAYMAGDKETTKKLMAENKFTLTNKDIKTEIANQKRKALDAYLDGDKETTKKIRDQYKLQFTNRDVQNRAKSKAISLYKIYRASENPEYLEQVKALKDQYGFTIKNSDVQ